MAVKILGRSGVSLADTYDVSGSIAGVERLDSEEVKTVHEMGGTIFSERFSGAIRRMSTGVILQSLDFNVVITDLPATPTRILGIQIFTDAAARLARAALVIRDGLSGREMPVWVWDQTNNLDVDFSDNGDAVASHEVLVPDPRMSGAVPNMLIGNEQPQVVSDLALRGRTTAFGAGNVTIIAIIYIAFSQVGGLSSRGLPFPGW